MSASRPSVYQNVDPDIIEIVKGQIELYHTVVYYSLAMAGRKEEAEEFSRLYYTDLIRFSLYAMRLDGSVSSFEAEMFNLLFGSKKSSKELERLTAQFDQENMAAYTRQIPESVTILVEMFDCIDGEDAFDPMAIPQLYVMIAAAIGEADGVFDASEAEGIRTFVENLIAYVVSVVGEPDVPPVAAAMSRETALALLGLTAEELNPQAVKKAYRNAMQLNHPDRHRNNESLRKYAEEQCFRINEARDVLMREIEGIQTDCLSDSSGKASRQQASTSQSTSAESEPKQDEGSSAKGKGAVREGAKDVRQCQDSSSANDDAGGTDALSKGSFTLTSWKTSIGFSVLGVIAGFVLWIVALTAMFVPMVMATGLTSPTYIGSLFGWIAMFMSDVVQFVYAIVLYQSYFRSKPLLKSNRAISFCNLLFSNFVIGPLWNSNLTRSRNEGRAHKGVSYIVHCVFLSFSLALVAYGFPIVWGPVLDEASSHPAIYSNYNAGISISYPSDWTSEELSEKDNAQTVLLKLRPENTRTVGAGVSVIGAMTKGEFELLTVENARAIVPDGISNWTEESVKKISIGDDSYWVLIGQGVIEGEEESRPIKLAWWLTAQNGLAFCFEFYDYLAGNGFDRYYRDFEGIVASARYDIV